MMNQNNSRNLIVTEWVTLDGVFDADTMDQWYAPYDSPERQTYIQQNINTSDAFLLGRTSYEMLAPYWSAMQNNEMGVAGRLNSAPKYVVSSTLQKADWNNSTILRDNVAQHIQTLKQQPGQNILIMGSGTLVRSLMKSNLIDEYRLLVHPHIMGNGKRFFRDEMTATGLELVNTKTLTHGVIALDYKPKKS